MKLLLKLLFILWMVTKVYENIFYLFRSILIVSYWGKTNRLERNLGSYKMLFIFLFKEDSERRAVHEFLVKLTRKAFAGPLGK